MNDAELLQLIADHYQGEAQLLTTGAEENLLKLAELRGNLTPEQAARWAQIRADFQRSKAMGGSDGDVGVRVVAQLRDLADGVQGLGATLAQPAAPIPWDELLARLEALASQRPQVEVAVAAAPQPDIQGLLEGLAQSLQGSFLPLIQTIEKKGDIGLRIHKHLHELSRDMRELGLRHGREVRDETEGMPG
jgi:hypothetical protein